MAPPAGPRVWQIAFVDSDGSQARAGCAGKRTTGFTVVESFRHSDRTLIAIEKMRHSDSTSFAMVGVQFRVPLPTDYPLNGWNRETGRDGYERACRIVLAFLGAKLKSESETIAAIDRDARPGNGINLRRVVAIPPPPSPPEAAALVDEQGLDAAKRAFVTSCGENSVASCMDIDRFNNWGITCSASSVLRLLLPCFN
jgi:hypothetical protein